MKPILYIEEYRSLEESDEHYIYVLCPQSNQVLRLRSYRDRPITICTFHVEDVEAFLTDLQNELDWEKIYVSDQK